MKPANCAPPDIQQILQNDDNFSSVFPPQNLNHSYQSPLMHSFPIADQLFHQNHHHFRPPFHQQEETLPVNFKLGLHQSQQMLPSWDPHQDSTSTKQPLWKQLSRSSSNNNNNEQLCENEGKVHNEVNKTQYCKPVNTQQIDESNDKYRFYGELEAICIPAKVCETNQTASGSALTGENSPKNARLSMQFKAINDQNAGASNAIIGVDHGSENSIGDRKSQKKIRKRKLKEKLGSMGEFFENLVKQVMDHQEMLHRKFLQVINRMDKERTEREEEWRRQEAAKYSTEAITRAHEQSLASTREAQIISCIEKITGQTINLPARTEIHQIPTKELADNHSRWPKPEVEALIQARSSIERKFQEPGLKGPLWEEVSSLMGSMGYQRGAKRCKEKWENINKYFRKAKESRKKRSQQSNTCSYFNQLDKLYSTASINISSLSTEIGLQNHGYSEVLAALIANSTNSSFDNERIDELVPSRLEFDGIVDDKSDHEDDYEAESDDGGSDEEI